MPDEPPHSHIWQRSTLLYESGAMQISERILAANDAYQYDDDRDHQEDVDKPAERVRRDDAQEPQDEKYDRNSDQHMIIRYE